MASRPRRSAAARAQENITVQSRLADFSDRGDRAIMSFRKTGRMPSAMVSRDPPSSPGGDSHLSVTVKVPSTKLRQATMTAGRRYGQFEGGEIVHGKRNRGGKKSYVVDSSPDVEDDDEEEEEAVIEEDEEEEEDLDVDDGEDDEDENEDVHEPEDEDMEDQDAEGEDEMDVDAEGDVDVAVPSRVQGPVIKVSRPTKIKPILRVPTVPKPIQPSQEQDGDDDDDDDELSEPAESDLGDETMGYGDETMADEDAEGEEIEVAGDEEDEEEDEEEDDDEEEEEEEEVEEPEEPEEEEEEEVVGRASHKSVIARRAANRVSDDEPDSEDEGSRDETPDLAKMTKRQRARFEDAPQEYMKLSDEIQVKKVFTAEELSMRRQEMARRRRNLSEKRNEEVKMETINKLLKKQAPKINRKTAMAADGRTDSLDNEGQKPSPFFIRWVSNKNGSQVAVPREILEGPVGRVFGDKAGTLSGKMVEEVV